MYTELTGRILWYDGSVTVDPADLMSLVLKSRFKGNLYTTEITKEVTDFNKLVDSDDQISIKHKNKELDTSWNIPNEYNQININDYILNKLINEVEECNLSDLDFKVRYNRIKKELRVYDQLNLNDLLKTLVYVIDTFNKENIVWGVGRGSSVSSYVLYLIGVHDIDSVLYDLNFNDFLTGE